MRERERAERAPAWGLVQLWLWLRLFVRTCEVRPGPGAHEMKAGCAAATPAPISHPSLVHPPTDHPPGCPRKHLTRHTTALSQHFYPPSLTGYWARLHPPHLTLTPLVSLACRASYPRSRPTPRARAESSFPPTAKTTWACPQPTLWRELWEGRGRWAAAAAVCVCVCVCERAGAWRAGTV
jgi:hypothetical protein